VLRRQLRSPEGLEATLSLAEASLDGEVPGEAIELLEGSRKTYATEPRLLALLARAYRQIGQPHPATVCLEQAVALAPKSPRLLAELRDAYAAEGRWAEALRTEDSLLTSLRRPDQILAEQPRIRALRYEAALVADGNAAVVRELRSIHARDPAFVPAAVSLGDGLKHSGQFREASRVWLRTVRLRPEPVLLSRIESLFKELERPKKVLALYRRLRRRGDSLPLLLRHVRFLVSEGRVNEAAEELEQAGARFSHVSELQALWGEVHRLRGNSDKALEAFRRALENQLALEAPVHCGRCARAVTEWQARCPGCGAWDSLQSATR
jgi:tetratricopeptide (TPR) repeat protein